MTFYLFFFHLVSWLAFHMYIRLFVLHIKQTMLYRSIDPAIASSIRALAHICLLFIEQFALQKPSLLFTLLFHLYTRVAAWPLYLPAQCTCQFVFVVAYLASFVFPFCNNNARIWYKRAFRVSSIARRLLSSSPVHLHFLLTCFQMSR